MARKLKPSVAAKVDSAGVLVEMVRLTDGIQVFPPSATDDVRAKLAGRAGGYHRIVWYDATGKRHTTTGGRTFHDAVIKAESIDAIIESGADKAGEKVSTLISAYLAPGLVKPGKTKPRSEKTLDGYDRLLRRFVLPTIGHMRCGELTPIALKAVLEAKFPRRGAKTPMPLSADDSERVRGVLTRLLKFGAGNGYITQDVNVLIQSMAIAVTVDVSQPRKSTEQGFHIDHIEKDSVPSHEKVAALAHQMALKPNAPWWYELMVYVAAYSGLRIGELEGLELRDIEMRSQDESGRLKARLRVERQINVIKGRPKEMLPKGDKRRTTVYPINTPATSFYQQGYPLQEKLMERAGELKNLNDKLFPAPSGGYWWRSNFYRRVFAPAAHRAGWYPKGAKKPTWTWHSLRHVFCTYYLWDLGKSPRAVADAAGHSSVSVTLNLYGGAGVQERLNSLD